MPTTDELRNYAEQAIGQAEKFYTSVRNDERVAKYVASAEKFYTSVRNDERVGRYVAGAETAARTAADTVNERIIQPVLAATGLGQQRPGPGDTTDCAPPPQQ